MKTRWTLASRGSKLALWQAEFIRRAICTNFPECEIEIRVIKTSGDTARWAKLWQEGGKGLFTKEIEEALLSHEADLAVHSLKDLPTELTQGLSIGAIPQREAPQDVLISKDNVRFDNLPPGSKVGTSSFRRRSQLLRMRKDLKFVDARGNVPTRIRKVQEGGPLDAVVMAKAGLKRLGLEEFITQEFSLSEVLPAPGQGALAVEIRANDDEAKELLRPIQDEDCFLATSAERVFLAGLGGGCRLPIAAYGEVIDETLILEGLVASADGEKVICKEISGKKKDYEKLGKDLANIVLKDGALEVLKS